MAAKKKAAKARGRPEKPADLKRSVRLVALLTEDEYAELQREAADFGERELYLWVRRKLTTPFGAHK